MSLPSPVVAAPDEGQVFRAGPFTITARLVGDQTGRTFELYELALGAATIDYHVHRAMDETLCVVEGRIEFNVAGTRSLRPAGSVAFVPRGVHHGFRNPGPEPARVLIVFSPAHDQDAYFRELERLFAAPTLDAEALRALQLRYDQELMPED